MTVGSTGSADMGEEVCPAGVRRPVRLMVTAAGVQGLVGIWPRVRETNRPEVSCEVFMGISASTWEEGLARVGIAPAPSERTGALLRALGWEGRSLAA